MANAANKISHQTVRNKYQT